MSKRTPDEIRSQDATFERRQRINQAQRVSEVKSFQTTDGATFEHFGEAKIHAASLGLAKLIEETGIGSGGPCCADDVLTFLQDNAPSLATLLTDYGDGQNRRL